MDARRRDIGLLRCTALNTREEDRGEMRKGKGAVTDIRRVWKMTSYIRRWDWVEKKHFIFVSLWKLMPGAGWILSNQEMQLWSQSHRGAMCSWPSEHLIRLEPAEEFKGGNRCIFIVRWKNKGRLFLFFVFFCCAYVCAGRRKEMGASLKMCDSVLMCKYRDTLKAEDLETVRYSSYLSCYDFIVCI